MKEAKAKRRLHEFSLTGGSVQRETRGEVHPDHEALRQEAAHELQFRESLKDSALGGMRTRRPCESKSLPRQSRKRIAGSQTVATNTGPGALGTLAGTRPFP